MFVLRYSLASSNGKVIIMLNLGIAARERRFEPHAPGNSEGQGPTDKDTAYSWTELYVFDDNGRLLLHKQPVYSTGVHQLWGEFEMKATRKYTVFVLCADGCAKGEPQFALRVYKKGDSTTLKEEAGGTIGELDGLLKQLP